MLLNIYHVSSAVITKTKNFILKFQSIRGIEEGEKNNWNEFQKFKRSGGSGGGRQGKYKTKFPVKMFMEK